MFLLSPCCPKPFRSYVRVIDEPPEFDSFCGEQGTGTLIGMVFVLIIDADDDDLDRKFRIRPNT